MAPSDSENVGIALALVCGAGASTALGAAVVFFPSVVKLASRRVLASLLGFSAGVMTYISFVEIFQKSVGSFVDSGKHDDDLAYQLATVCFFAGVVIMMMLNWVVSALLRISTDGDEELEQDKTEKSKEENFEGQNQQHEHGHDRHAHEIDPCPCHSSDPVGRLNEMNRMADELANKEKDEKSKSVRDEEDISHLRAHSHAHGHDHGAHRRSSSEGKDAQEDQKLVRMGINTALAIGLHNFPEGLATFVAALNDPAVGAVLAFAIAIHNIPEGLCVALPIYYATGRRMNAFLWALVSGASEFVAALLGWAVLANSFSDELYATLFGMVAGMMVIISIRELLPTAHFYDPEDTVVTYSFIVGMIVIAASLVLFTL